MSPTDPEVQVAAVSSHLKSQPAFGGWPSVIEPVAIHAVAIVTGKLPERKGSVGVAVAKTPVSG